MGSQRKEKKKEKKQDPNELQIRKGIVIIHKHGFLSKISYLSPQIVGKNELGRKAAAVSYSDGKVQLNKSLFLSPKQWAYAAVHCMLHNCFGHYDLDKVPGLIEEEDGKKTKKPYFNKKIWNIACDIYIAKFLEDIKFGESLNKASTDVFPSGILDDEIKIYDYLIREKWDENDHSYGVGPSDGMDMSGLENPLKYEKDRWGFQRSNQVNFDKVISGMIADAWYSVTEYHLRMGTKDGTGKSVNSIERAFKKLDALECLEHAADRRTVLATIADQEELLHDEKYQISKNVPYRVLSSFLKEIGGNDPLWDQRKRLIAYLDMINKRACIPYTIGCERGLKKRIILENRWKHFLVDNMVSLRGWIQMKKIRYLQDRNPGVPGIIYKLEPENEKQRKLQNARKLWASVIDISDLRDNYSGKPIGLKDYEIDHFVPWSYITNDEMWNLMPINASLNSSKRDRLPDWNYYFDGFAQNQFTLNRTIYRYPEIMKLFINCQRDNLNSSWSTEELYIKEIEEKQFKRVLESRLKPIYESAHTQGYSIWKDSRLVCQKR